MLTEKRVAHVLRAMPAGTKRVGCYADWVKRGGHAGARQMGAAIARLEAIGFVRREKRVYDTPDGSAMTTGVYYEDAEGNTFTARAHYGITARQNRFTIAVVFTDLPRGAEAQAAWRATMDAERKA